MSTLRSLYEKIPKKSRKPVVNWVFPFLFGLLITWIWGVGALFTILLILFFVSAMISALGNREARVIGKWSIGQYFKRIRGMILFALLPAVWKLVLELIKNPSLESILPLLVIFIVALSIWVKFEEIIKDITKQIFGTRRRRRRRRR